MKEIESHFRLPGGRSVTVVQRHAENRVSYNVGARPFSAEITAWGYAMGKLECGAWTVTISGPSHRPAQEMAKLVRLLPPLDPSHEPEVRIRNVEFHVRLDGGATIRIDQEVRTEKETYHVGSKLFSRSREAWEYVYDRACAGQPYISVCGPEYSDPTRMFALVAKERREALEKAND